MYLKTENLTRVNIEYLYDKEKKKWVNRQLKIQKAGNP